MTDARIVRLARSVVGVSAVLTVLAVAAVVATGHVGVWISEFRAIAVLPALFFAFFVWLVIEHQPRNRVVWIMAICSGLAGAFTVLSGFLILSVAGGAVPVGVVLHTPFVPAELPDRVAWIRIVSDPIGMMTFTIWLTFGIFLFPDGNLPSRKLRWLPWMSAVGVVCNTVGYAWIARPRSIDPVDDGLLFDGGLGILFVAMGLSVGTLVWRLRTSEGVRRQQLKWVMWGAAVFVPAEILAIVLGGTEYQSVAVASFAFGEIVALTSYGIAVGRYRLYDIDLVISRTVVYGALAAFIGVVYVGVVVGIGSLVGSRDGPHAVLAIGASAIVAVGFQPVRRRMERVANRLVFGRKATPYQVLSDFSRRVATTGGTLLADAARSLVEGTGAERVVISVAIEGDMVEAASWPDAGDVGNTEPVVFPIEHEGAELGRLELRIPTGQRLQEDDARLARQLASGMGLSIRNQGLTRRLESRVRELRESRRRLVAVQDETRRRLERDLHDGAQQQLVALKVKLGLARSLAAQDGANATTEILETLAGQADTAVETMREFARGVYPPLLEAEGLAAAVSSQARRAPIPVSVRSDGVGRYERDVESAVYFCVTEALQNTARHARATRADVSLVQRDGLLTFEIRDDGIGFDPASPHTGMGLVYMTDRAEALSGAVAVASTHDDGTVVTGTIPARVLA